MNHYIVYTKPNCHLCEEMKTLIVEKGGTYESINMLELPHNEVLNLRAWARAARQMSMPIVKTPDGTFITNDDMIKLLTEE